MTIGQQTVLMYVDKSCIVFISGLYTKLSLLYCNGRVPLIYYNFLLLLLLFFMKVGLLKNNTRTWPVSGVLVIGETSCLHFLALMLLL
jgi:hypothetical protein